MNNSYSNSRYTNTILKMIDRTVGLNTLDNYIDNISLRNYVEFESLEQVELLFSESIFEFLSNLSYDELMYLRSYTGYNYKFINALLRDNWFYDEHGMLTNDKRNDYRNLSLKISSILSKFNSPNIDFSCFRGTTLDSFSSYGVMNLNDLNKLKGEYLYDPAFTSTSILKSTSYIDKKLDDGRLCNIGIKYLIPSEGTAGALLINRDTSYSTNQNEFLLNNGSLSKVIDVHIDQVNNTAILTVILIPKKIYEVNYDKDNIIKR